MEKLGQRRLFSDAHAGAREPLDCFVPECLTLSYVETDLQGLLEFTNLSGPDHSSIRRQSLGPRSGHASSLLHDHCLRRDSDLEQHLRAETCLHIVTLTFLPALLSAIRSSIRLIGVTEALPAGKSEIMGQAWIYILLTVFIPFLYLMNFVNSLCHT